MRHPHPTLNFADIVLHGCYVTGTDVNVWQWQGCVGCMQMFYVKTNKAPHSFRLTWASIQILIGMARSVSDGCHKQKGGILHLGRPGLSFMKRKMKGFSCGSNFVWRWAEKFIGWLWCNGRIWPDLVIFQHLVSNAVHTLLPLVLQRLDSHGYRSSHPDPQKINSSTADDLIIGPILLPSQVFFHVGEQKIDMVPNQENM